jgi:hypothetical protein
MFLGSLGALVAAAPVAANASRAVHAGKPTADTPVATVIPGHPPVLDFGDDLKIPCDKSAFLTLWEGKTFWLTFGAGRSAYAMQAQGQAVNYANGSMKLLLMTLAFAPDRMVHSPDGGWRMKPAEARHFVLGDVELPGLPYWPINDTDFTGFGQKDSAALGGAVTSEAPSPTGTRQPGVPTVDPSLSFDKVDSFTCYIVLKKDLSLQDVRDRSVVLIE